MQEISSDNIRTYYAIVGDLTLENKFANIYPKQRISAIGSAMARYPNVPITTFTSKSSTYHDAEMFVDFIDKLYRSYVEGKFGVGRTIGFKKSEHKSFDEYVLSGVPGISRERASDILQHFDIEYNIIPRNSERVSNVLSIKGIGHKTWSNIKKELKLWMSSELKLCYMIYMTDKEGYPTDRKIINGNIEFVEYLFDKTNEAIKIDFDDFLDELYTKGTSIIRSKFTDYVVSVAFEDEHWHNRWSSHDKRHTIFFL